MLRCQRVESLNLNVGRCVVAFVSVDYCGGAGLTVSACIQGRRPGLGGPREQPSPPPGPLLGQGPYSFYRQVDIWSGPHRQNHFSHYPIHRPRVIWKSHLQF